MAILALTLEGGQGDLMVPEQVPEVRSHSCGVGIGLVLSIINLPCWAVPFLGLWPGKLGFFGLLFPCGISELPVVSRYLV